MSHRKRKQGSLAGHDWLPILNMEWNVEARCRNNWKWLRKHLYNKSYHYPGFSHAAKFKVTKWTNVQIYYINPLEKRSHISLLAENFSLLHNILFFCWFVFSQDSLNLESSESENKNTLAGEPQQEIENKVH